MAKVIHLLDATRNAMVDAISALIDAGAAGGTIKVYDGTIPATAATAVSSQTLLATLTFSGTAFGSAVSGVATAGSITADAAADATGTATWARIADSNGNTVMDVNVGATGSTSAIEFNTDAFVSGAAISITSFTMTMPAST